jgi:hypothetical protein
MWGSGRLVVSIGRPNGGKGATPPTTPAGGLGGVTVDGTASPVDGKEGKIAGGLVRKPGGAHTRIRFVFWNPAAISTGGRL